jgi:hypothetical protein
MWILPSRNRPDRVSKMFDVAPPSTHGIVAIDDDQRDMYAGVKLPLAWQLFATPRKRYIAKHNEAFENAPDRKWYGSLSDDMMPITPEWDLALIQRAGDRGIAYANDRFTMRCGAFAMGGELARRLGWIFPPCFVHYFGDKALEVMCSELGLPGLQDDVVVEHRHYSPKRPSVRGKYDDTSRDRPSLSEERVVWDRWFAKEWPAIKEKLLAHA